MVLCYLMVSHCNPMAFNLRIPTFIVAFSRVRRWVVYYVSMQFIGSSIYCISSSATRSAGGHNPPLARSLKNFSSKHKRLNLFLVGPESKRGWAIPKFGVRKSSSITSHAVVHLLQSTIVSSFFLLRGIYPPYACYTSHKSRLLTYVC